MGHSGIIDPATGVVLSFPRPGQMTEWKNVPLQHMLEQEFAMPCILEDGPGPGLATDSLRRRFANLTCIEIDPLLAGSLSERMEGTKYPKITASITAYSAMS